MKQAIISGIIGLWLMISPVVLPVNKSVADNNHIVGPLVMTASIVAFWEINRGALRTNLVFAVWMLLSLFLLDYSRTFIFISNGLCGVALFFLSLKVKKSTTAFGGGWHSLFQHNPPHLREAERKTRS